MEKSETLESLGIIKQPVQEKERTLIIGAGEIGRSLGNVLSQAYDVVYRDRLTVAVGPFRVINICYPYSKDFVQITKGYINLYKPELCIIHSTVKPGVTRSIGDIAVHSPVNGRHPYLENSIVSFTKFIGGTKAYKVYEAVNYLNKAGITTHVFSSPEACEVAKIRCTKRFGWSVVEMKETVLAAQKYNVPFHEIYTEWNQAYNQGYAILKEPRFMRPTLYPMEGGICGHCVIPNLDLDDDFMSEVIKGRNEIYKNDNKRNASGEGDKNLASRTIKSPNRVKRHRR